MTRKANFVKKTRTPEDYRPLTNRERYLMWQEPAKPAFLENLLLWAATRLIWLAARLHK